MDFMVSERYPIKKNHVGTFNNVFDPMTILRTEEEKLQSMPIHNGTVKNESVFHDGMKKVAEYE